MQIITEKLDIDETLNKKIKNILKFLNIKEKIQRGNIINISKTKGCVKGKFPLETLKNANLMNSKIIVILYLIASY